MQLNMQAVLVLFFYGAIVDLAGTAIGGGEYLMVGFLIFLEEFGELSGLMFAFIANLSILWRTSTKYEDLRF